ncbi:hypothetical protein Tco_0847785 [Tanacetum coccineum]
MPIPNEPISNNIRNASYYNAYLEMVTKHDQKVAAQKEGKKKSASTKQPKPKPAIKKLSKPAPAPKTKPKVTKEKPSKASTAKPPKLKPAKEKSTKATPLQKADKGKVTKVRTVKSTFQLVDEPDEEPAHSEPEPEPEHQGEGEEFDIEHAIGTCYSNESGIVSGTKSNTYAETGARSYKTNIGGDTEILQITEELGEDVDKQENVKEKTVELDQDQAGSDPTHESQPSPEQVLIDEDQAGPDPGISRVALAGPDLEPTHDEFMADLYPKVQKSLKFSADKHVILEDPLRKLNVEAEVVSMVTVPIYQASSSVLPLSTPLRDLPHKIDEVFCENVKEAIQIALQAPLRDRFRDLSKEDMKEMLHQRMFESSTYKSLPGHIALYEALEASMARAQRGEFFAKKDKSRKRRRDDQDPPPPSDLNLKDTDSAHLLKIKQRPKWLKPIPDDERPATPEPAWVIHTSYIPDAVNNWANALATTYQASAENSLLEKTRDMRTFMNWYCQKMGKIELTQADFEDQIDWAIQRHEPSDSSDTIGTLLGSAHMTCAARYIRIEDFSTQNSALMSYQKSIESHSTGWSRAQQELISQYKTRLQYNFVMLARILRAKTDKDVAEDDRRRSKEFMEVNERRLKIRRIFRNLECFVGGRLRDVDYRLIQRTK